MAHEFRYSGNLKFFITIMAYSTHMKHWNGCKILNVQALHSVCSQVGGRRGWVKRVSGESSAISSLEERWTTCCDRAQRGFQVTFVFSLRAYVLSVMFLEDVQHRLFPQKCKNFPGKPECQIFLTVFLRHN